MDFDKFKYLLGKLKADDEAGVDAHIPAVVLEAFNSLDEETQIGIIYTGTLVKDVNKELATTKRNQRFKRKLMLFFLLVSILIMSAFTVGIAYKNSHGEGLEETDGIGSYLEDMAKIAGLIITGNAD